MTDDHRPRLVQLRGPRGQLGAVAFIHPCYRCGAKNAPFGFGCDLRSKPRKPGKWLCWECWNKERDVER